MSSADNLCKQFEPRQNVRRDLDPNFLTLMVYLKEFLEKLILKKIRQPKSMDNYPVGKEFKVNWKAFSRQSRLLSRLLLFLGGLYCKQYGPRLDCFQGVCFYDKILSEVHSSICSRHKNRWTFQDKNKLVGRLRINNVCLECWVINLGMVLYTVWWLD